MADTQPLAPTDAEIVALADATRTAEGGASGYILPISFARAVLAKWGTPPPCNHGAQPAPNAVIVSGYSGDPDSRGTLLVKALDLTACKVGDYLYAAPQPAPQQEPDEIRSYAATHAPADSVLEDAARLDWLLLRISGAEFRRIGVHYSGNARRADVDAARKQGANHD